MRSFSLAAACLALVCSGNARAFAQPKVVQLNQVQLTRTVTIGSRSANPLQLLRNPAVQKELKVDDDQKSEITEAQKTLNADRKVGFAKLRKLDRNERQKAARKMNAKYTADSTKKVKGILEDEQYARLQQIMVQMQGNRALQSPDVKKQLKITDEQTQKIAAIQQETNKKRGKEFQALRGNGGKINFKKFQEITKKLQAEQAKQTLEVLSKEQQAAFAKLKGKKFAFPRRAAGLRGAPGGIRLQIQGVPGAKIRLRRVKPGNVKPAKKAKKKNDK